MGTKFYLCHTEENSNHGYNSQLLPLMFLPDDVATQSEPSRIIGDLWQERYRYYMPFDPPEGTQFFAMESAVVQYIGRLKQILAESRRPQTATRTLGRVERTGPESWVMHGAGGGAVAGVDVGNGQVAFDIETWGGGGGGSIPLQAGDSEVFDIDVPDRDRNRPVPIDGEWGSLSQPRSLSARQQRIQRRNATNTPRHMAERNVSMRYGDELPVHVRMVDGSQETCTIDHYNRMVESGRWVGFERI